ncbi:MAG: zinc-dependent peptidase [Bacteroidetes bacterium]|nr:zinc-dependent peptidase [Bacteroidota bacterium]
MPQDSTTLATNLTDSAQLQDSINALLKNQTPVHTDPYNDALSGQGELLLIYFCVIMLVILSPTVINAIRFYFKKKQKTKEYESNEVVFDNLLQHYNPYYKSLNAEYKSRFMKRVLQFMEAKDFKYIDIGQEDMMPLLISSAAVQLTFGLNNFMLDYFKTIFVVRDNYTYGLYNVPFEGHVSEDGIYLSWSNFIRQYNDYTDGENVGLHELAHALGYVNFTVDDGQDKWFHNEFLNFSKTARPVFERMKDGEDNLLNKYAATNYNEFWAVCVETFFERAETFRQQQPDLYFALCKLLNQDPMTENKILNAL